MLTDFEALEANLRESFRVLAEGRPRADIVELTGVTIASLGAAFQMFNAAFLSAPVSSREILEIRIRAARDLFTARGLAWAFWVCEDWLERPARRVLTRVFESHGLHAVSEMPAMAAESLRDPAGLSRAWRPLPQLEVRRADSERTMADFRAIGSVCFHVPAVWFGEVFDDSLPSRPFTCWVAYRDSRPVATAATVVAHEAIGLYNVATMPDDRGKGYAEVITRHAIASAARESGLQRVILQSTSLGERLYRRLGFREISRVIVFNSAS